MSDLEKLFISFIAGLVSFAVLYGLFAWSARVILARKVKKINRRVQTGNRPVDKSPNIDKMDLDPYEVAWEGDPEDKRIPTL